MGTIMDHAANAARHRKHADECRTIASMMDSEAMREQYLKLAEAYEQLADNEEMVGANIAKLPQGSSA